MERSLLAHIIYSVSTGLALFFITLALLSPAWSQGNVINGVSLLRCNGTVNDTGLDLDASAIRGFTNERVCVHGLCMHSRRKWNSLQGYEKTVLCFLITGFLLVTVSFVWSLTLFCASCSINLPLSPLIFLGGLAISVALIIYGTQMKNDDYSMMENARSFGYSFHVAVVSILCCGVGFFAGVYMLCSSKYNKVSAEDENEISKEELYPQGQVEDVDVPPPR